MTIAAYSKTIQIFYSNKMKLSVETASVLSVLLQENAGGYGFAFCSASFSAAAIHGAGWGVDDPRHLLSQTPVIVEKCLQVAHGTRNHTHNRSHLY